jgi:hypothetical protein
LGLTLLPAVLRKPKVESRVLVGFLVFLTLLSSTGRADPLKSESQGRPGGNAGLPSSKPYGWSADVKGNFEISVCEDSGTRIVIGGRELVAAVRHWASLRPGENLPVSCQETQCVSAISGDGNLREVTRPNSLNCQVLASQPVTGLYTYSEGPRLLGFSAEVEVQLNWGGWSASVSWERLMSELPMQVFIAPSGKRTAIKLSRNILCSRPINLDQKLGARVACGMRFSGISRQGEAIQPPLLGEPLSGR